MPKQILIVEDEPIVAEFLREVLEGAGYAVRQAGDGSRGLAALQESPADLLIIDLIIPVVSGLEVIRQVVTCELRPKIIAVSAGGLNMQPDPLLVVAKGLGADTWLRKPFYPQDLRIMVEALIGPAVESDPEVQPLRREGAKTIK